VCSGPLAALAGVGRTYRTSLFLTGRGESHVEQKVQPIYSRWRDHSPPITTTILAALGQIELHLSVRDVDEARARATLARAKDELMAVVAEDVYSTDGRGMEEVVGAALKARGYTVAAAESCTGGLFSSRLTDVAGSSSYVRAGVIAYANEDKTALLGVPADLIAAHGAVSEPVAVAMAEGIRERTGADVTVGITGIAGPGGGTPAKPVGTVAIAVIVPDQPAYVRTYQFIGGRTMVKFQATQAAMDRIRRMLS
jgi:nicotinamide-nucleotide amidase